MSSRTTSDSCAQPPKNLIFCIGVPILYGVVHAPFRKECEVYAKLSGGCSCTTRSTRCSHAVKVSAVQFAVGSCRLMAHRLSGIFPAETLVRAASKYFSSSAMSEWAESGSSHRSFRSVEVPRSFSRSVVEEDITGWSTQHVSRPALNSRSPATKKCGQEHYR
jgi:hypothetical protein